MRSAAKISQKRYTGLAFMIWLPGRIAKLACREICRASGYSRKWSLFLSLFTFSSALSVRYRRRSGNVSRIGVWRFSDVSSDVSSDVTGDYTVTSRCSHL